MRRYPRPCAGKSDALEPDSLEARPSPDGAFRAPTGTTVTDAERNQITQRIALLERAATLFDRFGGLIPMAIAFLNKWPAEVELYPHWQVGKSWKLFLSLYLYWFAWLALGRAISFAKAGIDP